MQSIQKYRDQFYLFRQDIKKRIHYVINGGCAILLYHRVTNLETDPQLLAVSTENFYEQIKYLKKYCNVLRIDEFLEIKKKKGKFPRKSCVLTFDDGYADNYLEALPILEANNMQAIFYISTCNLNTDREFWWDEMERVLLLTEKTPAELKTRLNETEKEFCTTNYELCLDAYNFLLPVLRNMNPNKRNKKIEEFAQWSGNMKGRETHRSLTYEELKALDRSDSVVIGAHTHNHPSLAALNYNDQFEEIKVSKDILESCLQRKIVHFSFPFGAKGDYNQNTLKICKELGFEMVCSNFAGHVFKEVAIMELPRLLVRNWNIKEFKAMINNRSYR